MKNKKLIITLVLLFSMLISLSGCSNDSAPENEKAGENTGAVDNKITVALSAQLLNLDPHVSMAPSDIVKKHVFEGLTYIDLEGKVHPWLAESWEVAPDNKTWTFHLKEGVKFHDGTDFNAEAVKITFERLLDVDNGFNRRYQLTFIDQINVIDEYTVEIVTKEPYCAMENILDWSGAHIISPAAIEKYGKDIAKYPVGTGPYKVAEFVSGEHVTLEKFNEYWGEKPSLDEVKFITVPEEGTRIAMLETGEVDYIVNLSPQEINRIEENPKLTVRKDPSNRVMQLGMNITNAPLDNKKVRQALNYAVDRELILENVMGGIGIPATSVIASNVWGYAEGIFPYEYNPEKAKQLLAEAGYPDGFDLTMWTTQGRYFRDKELNLAVAGMFQEIGVNAKVEVVD
jgi:ABC-type transport system substrate-binding protein